MLLLGSALAALAAIIEAPGSLREMIAELERGLGRALNGVQVAIVPEAGWDGAGGVPIPLQAGGHVVGGIVVRASAGEVDSEAVEILRLLAPPIAAAIVSRRRPQRRDHDARPANVDALCRIPNRRGFDEHLRAAWERGLESGVPIVVVLIDVDFFKTYNDRYGHVAGDGCLRQVASLLMKRRSGDDGFAARYGGEEFALVFEDTSVDFAVAEVQHIFERLAIRRIEHAGTTLGRVSLSAGVASLSPSPSRTMSQLIEDADRSLYQAKHFGRNRVCAGSFVSRAPVVARLQAQPRVHMAAGAPTFGRDDDLARILSALRYARMITLVGPRGIGKSRLLSLLADAVASRLHRPVIFLEPELLRAGMDPATVLASACELTLEAGGALDTVTDFLADRDAVLVLDDVDRTQTDLRALCNHLITRATGIAIVAAADAQIGIAHERSIVVAPLDDDASLELLTLRSGADGAASRAAVPYLGGNPAMIEAAAEAIRHAGISDVLRLLVERGGVCADAAEISALLAQPVLLD